MQKKATDYKKMRQEILDSYYRCKYSQALGLVESILDSREMYEDEEVVECFVFKAKIQIDTGFFKEAIQTVEEA